MNRYSWKGNYAFRPHELRAIVTQGIRRMMGRWQRDLRAGDPLSGYVSETFSDCLLDGFPYKDLHDAAGRPTASLEQIVGVAVEQWWNELWLRGGATVGGAAELLGRDLHALAWGAGWGMWEPTKWPAGASRADLGRLVRFAVTAALAPRRAHLEAFRIEDFRLEHHFADGSVGPALIYRGEAMKTGCPGYRYAVRLPQVLAGIIVAWLACNPVEPGEHGSLFFPRGAGEAA